MHQKRPEYVGHASANCVRRRYCVHWIIQYACARCELYSTRARDVSYTVRVREMFVGYTVRVCEMFVSYTVRVCEM